MVIISGAYGKLKKWVKSRIADIVLSSLKDVDNSNIANDKVLVYKSASGKHEYETQTGGGVTDHGALTGLADDDHPQYTRDAEVDAIVATHTAINAAHHSKYTDAEAVSAVATADDYVKNDEDDLIEGKLTIKNVGVNVSGGQKIVGENTSGYCYPGQGVYAYIGAADSHPFSGFYNAAGSEASPTILPINFSAGLFTFDAYNGTAFKAIARFGAMTEASFDGSHQNGRLEFSVGHDSTFVVAMALRTNGNLDLKDNIIQDPKNHTHSALSGTKKLVEIDIGGTPYYFEVYPTKA